MIEPTRHVDPQPEEDLEEILDLAAELAPPEKLADAWDRRARFDGDRFTHMMRYVAAREVEDPRPDPALADEREAARQQRDRIRAVISELGDLSPVAAEEGDKQTRALIQVSSRQAGWRWVEGSDPDLRARWRKPAAIAGGVAVAALVLGIGWRTLGPEVGSVQYTTPPVSDVSGAGGSTYTPFQPQPVYTPAYGVTPPATNPLVIPVPPAAANKPTTSPTSPKQIVSAPIEVVPTPTLAPTPIFPSLPPPPSANPTPAPTAAPTPTPTAAPTPTPTAAPTPTPTAAPTPTPTAAPTPTPTAAPTPTPTAAPTPNPTAVPTP